MTGTLIDLVGLQEYMMFMYDNPQGVHRLMRFLTDDFLSLARWASDEDMLRRDLHETLCAARDCPLEIIMKDVHTLHNEPSRAARWVELARMQMQRAGFTS